MLFVQTPVLFVSILIKKKIIFLNTGKFQHLVALVYRSSFNIIGNNKIMDRKNPENYQVEDFVADESFANYHFCLNITDQQFWETWLMSHPAKIAIAKEAKKMLQMLSLTVHGDEYAKELKKILRAINNDNISGVKGEQF